MTAAENSKLFHTRMVIALNTWKFVLVLASNGFAWRTNTLNPSVGIKLSHTRMVIALNTWKFVLVLASSGSDRRTNTLNPSVGIQICVRGAEGW